MPIRRLNKLTKHPKVMDFVQKYNIPQEYLVFTKKSVSNAVAIGLFIAMIPMPMQMLAVTFMMPFFRFNVAIGVLMCWVSNPFTMPIMYYLEYMLGNFILNLSIADNFELSIGWFFDNLDKIFIPLYFGTLIFSIVASASGYFLIKILWRDEFDSQL